MNFNYKHIIWDWNGTLLDDAWLCLDIINGLLHKRGMPEIDLNKYQQIFDFPVINFYLEIGFDFSKEEFHIPATEYIDEYNRRRFRCMLQQGAMEALSFFKSADVTQSVLSASKQSLLEEAIEHYSLRSFFTNIHGLDDYYAHSKMEIGKEHLALIGVAKEEILMIGDTTHDCEVAESMGIGCILISNGHHNRGKLELCGVPVFDTLSEIVNPARKSLMDLQLIKQQQ